MIFTRNIRKGDSEKVFLVVRNVAGDNLELGAPAVYRLGSEGTNWNGYEITTYAMGNLTPKGAFAGIAPQVLPSGQFGLVQAYGHFSRACLYGMAASWYTNIGTASYMEHIIAPQGGRYFKFIHWLSTNTTYSDRMIEFFSVGGLIQLVSTGYYRTLDNYACELGVFIRAL